MPRNKYPEQTVEKILNAAAALFAEKGYAHTTLQDIIDATGLSKGAVYHHFQSKEEIAANPTYVVLNLCRVLAYRKEGKILSKQEGGDWGLSRLSPRYRPLIQNALTAYQTGKAAVPDEALAREFAGEMLKAIRE